jgi:RNA 3'-terminal phosphate cyclase (ATP)
MKPAHLAGAEWLARATSAQTTGLEVKSRELIFRPTEEGLHIGGDRRHDKDWVERSEGEIPGVWKYVYDESGRLVRRDSYIHMSTPGSIFLVLQAILPYILFSAPFVPPGLLSDENANNRIPIQITIEGGTNVSNSPSFEYIDQVLLPMLNSKVGIPPISMKLNSRGWSQGRVDVGSVTFHINSIQHSSYLPSFSFTDRGELAKIHASILGPGTTLRTKIKDKVREHVRHLHPDVEIHVAVDEDSMHPKRLYLLLVAETTTGYRFGRDWLFDRKGDFLKLTDQLVLQVVKDLDEELAHGGCMDEYLQDQLVVFQALARGKSLLNFGKATEPSLHTRTVRWVGQKMLDLNFDNEGACEGISLRSGETLRGE